MPQERTFDSASQHLSNSPKLNWKRLLLASLASLWLPQTRAQAQDFEYNFVADQITPLDQSWSIQHEAYTRGSWALSYNPDIPWLSQISTYAHPNPERNFVKKLNRLQAYHAAPIFGFPSQVCSIEHFVNEAHHPSVLYSMRITGLNAALPELCSELKEVLMDPFPELSHYYNDLGKTHVAKSKVSSTIIFGALTGFVTFIGTAYLILLNLLSDKQNSESVLAQTVTITEPDATNEAEHPEDMSENSFELVEYGPSVTHSYRNHRVRDQKALLDTKTANALESMTSARAERESKLKQLTA